MPRSLFPSRHWFAALAILSLLLLPFLAIAQDAAAQPAASAKKDALRLHLADGTILTGDLSMDSVTVNTRYGPLTVPVTQIVSFTPGLKSRGDLAQRLADLLKGATREDPAEFEPALRQLEGLGPRIIPVIDTHLADTGNDDARQRLGELRARLVELQGDDDLFFDSDEPPTDQLLEGDLIVTPAFTIVGEITPGEFSVASKYGRLDLSLNDILYAVRDTGEAQTIAKSVTVQGLNMVQRQLASAGVRLQRGDRVSVEAEGAINYTPRGSNAMITPAGAANYGQYRPGIPVGTLMARIGSTGEMVNIGASQQFVADRNGELQFGWACADNYSTRNYNWTGNYKVKVKVTRPPGTAAVP